MRTAATKRLDLADAAFERDCLPRLGSGGGHVSGCTFDDTYTVLAPGHRMTVEQNHASGHLRGERESARRNVGSRPFMEFGEPLSEGIVKADHARVVP